MAKDIDINQHGFATPMLQLLADKYGFKFEDISNFTMYPVEEHMIVAWFDKTNDQLDVETIGYEEFTVLCDKALDTIAATSPMHALIVKNAMQHVELMDSLGIEMSEYPEIGIYLSEAHPGFLEMPPANMREVLAEARDYVREQNA